MPKHMKIFDAWNSFQSSQRKGKRYRARWKVTLELDSSSNKANFKTLIHDLSLNGISAQCHSAVKEHTILTLLLEIPPKEGAPRKIIKLKAEVKSSIPFRGSFRIGMSFIRDAELDSLLQHLEMYVVSDDSLYSDPEAEEFPQLNL
jgi:hypothetical protein